MVKKNDIVAVRETRTTHFVHGSRAPEQRDVWRLARCVSASRDGKLAKAISYPNEDYARKLEHLGRWGRCEVRHIDGDNQARAQRLWNAIDETAQWSSADELRAAILGA